MDIQNLVLEVLNKTKRAILQLATDATPNLIKAVDAYIALAQQRFTSLMSYMANGGDTRFLLDRLAEEKDVLKSQILSFIVMGKGIAEHLINSVQDILLTAVGQVLPAKL